MTAANETVKGWARSLYSPSYLEEKFSETELPTLPILGNWVSGVQNSRKLNLCHYSFLETLYVAVILCAADWGCARMHQQLSGVWSSRKLECSRSDSYELGPGHSEFVQRVADTRGARKLGFRYLAFSETEGTKERARGLILYGLRSFFSHSNPQGTAEALCCLQSCRRGYNPFRGKPRKGAYIYVCSSRIGAQRSPRRATKQPLEKPSTAPRARCGAYKVLGSRT